MRHARASRAAVEIAVGDQRTCARIVDDGLGFNVDAATLRSLGLAGMRERSMLVGGRLEIDSAPGRGTTVGLEVPR